MIHHLWHQSCTFPCSPVAGESSSSISIARGCLGSNLFSSLIQKSQQRALQRRKELFRLDFNVNQL